MHNFLSKLLAVIAIYFSRLPYIMKNKWWSDLLKLKNKNCENVKKDFPLFYIPEGQMHQNQSEYLFSFLWYSLV